MLSCGWQAGISLSNWQRTLLCRHDYTPYLNAPSPLPHPSAPASTLKSPFLFFSTSHFSIQAFIFSRLLPLPTLTVGITRPIRNAQQNMVNSRNELCSE